MNLKEAAILQLISSVSSQKKRASWRDFARMPFDKTNLILILFPVMLALGLSWQAPEACAQASAGYRDFYFGSTGPSEPTSEKPQSKLWWNDGSWWGSLWNPNANRYEIHRFDLATQSWIATGTALDTRSSSRGDALWDGQYLYLVSNIYSVNAGPTTSGNSARLYRFSYDTMVKAYSLDAGFPVLVNNSKSEALVLDKDSSGKLWITWAEGGKIMLNRTLGNDLTWGTPFILPVQGNEAHSDDISTLAAFGGNRIGVLWSNQKDSTMNFVAHVDGEADSVWLAREQILSGVNWGPVADDHFNLKAACDGSGNLYAVMKTNLIGSTSAGIFVLKRTNAGIWSRSVFATANLEHVKPIVHLNHENQRLYVFTRSTETGPGIIYMKSASLQDLEFPTGLGAAFITNAMDLDIHNPTSTKQCVNASSGLVILAADKTNRYYLHNYIDFSADKPVLASFTPPSGPINTEVTIFGQNFNTATRVAFNDVPATSFTCDSNTQIRARVPGGAALGKISITNAIDIGASANDFIVTAPPAITSFTPTNGPSGGEVTILGKHFASVASVKFNGTLATSFTIDSNTQLRAIAPPEATTGKITVINPDGSATSANDFIVTQQPVLVSFSPEHAQSGAEVTITGNHFTAATQVTFNGAAANFTLDSDTQLRALVPPNATTGKISITNSAGTGLSVEQFFMQYALSVNVQGSGSVTLNPSGNVYDQGASVTVTATPAVGWKFQDWDGALDGPTMTQTVVMASDKSVTAIFAALAQFTLTVDTLGTGHVTLDPPGGVYYNGATVTLMPHADSGYVFSGWQGDKKGYASPELITMTADKQVHAIFTKAPAKRASGIWANAAELSSLPITGVNWTNMKAEADLPAFAPNLANQNDSLNVRVMAKALVYARTGIASYREEVTQACMAVIGTEQNGETLALGRELIAYVIAADLVGLPLEQEAAFRAWLQTVLRDTLNDGRTLQSAHEERPNNWGTHCGASRAAIVAYLGDAAELARTALVFRGWLGNRYFYADFSYGEPWWQADSSAPVGINPSGATLDGHSVDGVLPDDQRRSGEFVWPPPQEDYVYEALQGAVAQAMILYRAGYDVWNWENAALRRAFEWLYQQANYPAARDDRWQLYIINHYYQTNFATPNPARPGKNVGWTNWTLGKYHTLTVNVIGSGNVALSPAGGIYEPGTNVELTATPAVNWEFSKWSGAATGVKNPIALKMNADKEVAATFIEITENMVKHEESRKGGSNNLALVTTSTELTAANDHLYLAAISTRPKAQVTAVSGLGLTWSLVKKQCSGRNAIALEVWRAQGAPDTNGAVTATFASAPNNAAITVSRYSGVDTSAAIGKSMRGNSVGVNGSCTGGTDSSFYSFNMMTSQAGVMLYCAAAMRNRTHTPGAGYAERIEIKQGASSGAASIAAQDRRINEVSSAPIKGSFSGNVDWAVVALEIKPKAASFALPHANEPSQQSAALPLDFTLAQNYPNPFNAATVIDYALPEPSKVRLRIFNPQGRLVRTLINIEQTAGYKSAEWDGRDETGNLSGSGVYFVELEAGARRLARKIMMVK